MIHLVEVIDGSLAVPFKRETEYTYTFDLPDHGLSYIMFFDQNSASEIEVFFKAYNTDEDARDATMSQIELGVKGAMIVFHTVWAILKDFLDTTLDPIDYVLFAAKESEPSRVTFYNRLSKLLAQHYGQDPDDVEIEKSEARREPQYNYKVPVFVSAVE